MGKLIVLEGLDGSGKSTQLTLLEQNLKAHGVNCTTVSFPEYSEPSSTLVKMYLGGEFGKTPGDVNAYAASLFFAVDRYSSFKLKWGEFYHNGGTVLAGRYVTSNAIHQTAKLPKEEWADYIHWLYELEYEKTGIPKPDLVLFLDMPTDISQKLLTSRYQGDEEKKDIHERDRDYLDTCRHAALFAAEYSGWKIISCANEGSPRNIADIAAEITHIVLNEINK